MINYIEKGIGLHEEIIKQGHWLVQINNVWTSSNDVAVQAIIDGYDPNSNTPESVTPRQIRQAMTRAGIRQEVEDYIANSSDYDLKDWWQFSTSFERNNAILNQAATALNYTPAFVDQVFRDAGTL